MALVLSLFPLTAEPAHTAPALSLKSASLTIGASKTIKVKNAPAKAKLTYKASPKSVVRVSKKGK